MLIAGAVQAFQIRRPVSPASEDESGIEQRMSGSVAII